MLLTEEETRKKWCPHVRHVTPYEDAGNRWRCDGIPKESRCIASQCMAWRWGVSARTVGYCGLSGKPEVAG